MAENDKEQELVDEKSDTSTGKIDELVKALKDKDTLLESKESEVTNLKIEIIKLKESLRKEGDILSREAERKSREEKGKLIKEFLEIFDNFGRALVARSDLNEHSLDGLLPIKNQMEKFLKESGVREIDLESKIFDPTLCEIGEIVERDDIEPNTILKVMRKGYYLNERILRTAVVSVAVPSKNKNDTEHGGV
jgi:molecular chaperone GrpE